MLVGTDMARDTEFYEQRIAQERAAATEATDPRVAQRHRELADLYAERLKAILSREQSAGPKLEMVFDEAQA